MHNTPQVWIACLACYNEGRLHGEWMDATDADEIREKITELQSPKRKAPCAYAVMEGKESGNCGRVDCDRDHRKQIVGGCGHIDNDWAIHDYDGMPSDMGENPNLDKLAELAQAIEEHGDAFRAYMENVGSEYATVEGFQDSYRGEFDTQKDYAYEYIDSTGMLEGVNSMLAGYIDYDSFARDLFMDGYSFVRYNGSGYVFCDY